MAQARRRPNPRVQAQPQRHGPLQGHLVIVPSAAHAAASASPPTLSDCYRASSRAAPMSAVGRLRAVATGSFREAQLQRQLSGNELGKGVVISRPDAAA